jgi:hypothetical protein
MEEDLGFWKMKEEPTIEMGRQERSSLDRDWVVGAGAVWAALSL